MDLDEILKKQSKRKKKVAPPKAQTLSIEEYARDDESRRPYKPPQVTTTPFEQVKKTPQEQKKTFIEPPEKEEFKSVKAEERAESTITVNKRTTIGEQVQQNTKNVTTRVKQQKLVTSGRPSDGRSSSKKLSSLVGVQRKVVLAMYESMKLSSSFQTQELTISMIANMTGEKAGVIKTNLYRLKQKGLLFLVEYKDGRGGWGKYSFDQELLQDLQSRY